MGLFKKNIDVESKNKDFYDNSVLEPRIGGVNVANVYSEQIKESVSQVDSHFTHVPVEKLSKEIIILRFELFALAWSHKYVSGKKVVTQSDFTKRYLHEKGRNDIWSGMEPYNNMIDSVTLHWLTSLGKANLSFNYNMREDLTKKNIEVANELGVKEEDVIARVNHRLWSENAWKQKLMLAPLVITLCDQIGANADDLNSEATFQLAATIKGLYDGAREFI
jgi:hypothetical protein